ncbi:MAG: DUF177 domain-containing protein [Bacteroidales bacterium]|nr:DUF177 domain-containing protein [Bacteroidales bacterium]
MNKKFPTVISLKGLAAGVHHYVWTLGQDFFDQFGNRDLREAHVEARVALEKQADRMMLEVALEGSVLRSCDRCLGDIRVPIDYCAPVVLQFGKNIPTEDWEQDGEIILLEPTEAELDLSQYLYDSACVSLPLQSLHPQGQCDPEMEKKIAELTVN